MFISSGGFLPHAIRYEEDKRSKITHAQTHKNAPHEYGTLYPHILTKVAAKIGQFKTVKALISKKVCWCIHFQKPDVLISTYINCALSSRTAEQCSIIFYI